MDIYKIKKKALEERVKARELEESYKTPAIKGLPKEVETQKEAPPAIERYYNS